MAAVTSFQSALTRLVLATTLASITTATPHSVPGLGYMEILKTASHEINVPDNIANLNMTVESSNIVTNGSLRSADSRQGVPGNLPIQQIEREEVDDFDYDGLNLDKTTRNEKELVDSNVISSRRGRMLGRLTKLMESATSALLGSSSEPEVPKNPKPGDSALPTDTSTQNPDESVQYVQAVRIPDHMRSQMVNKLRAKHQDQQHSGSSNQFDRQGKSHANFNKESNSFLGKMPAGETPTSQSLFETFQALFSKNLEHSTGKSDYTEHQKPSRPLTLLDRRPFHSNPLNDKQDENHGKHPSHVNYYNSHNDLPFFHEPTPLYVDDDQDDQDVKSHFQSISEMDSDHPEPNNYSYAFHPPRPYNTRPDAVASSVEITTFKPTVRFPVTTQTATASNPKKYTTNRRLDSPREIQNAPASLGILNHNLAIANEINDPYNPERVRYDGQQMVQYRDSVSHVQERPSKQSSRSTNLFDTNRRPEGNLNFIPGQHYQDSNELYSPSPRDETNNQLFNRPTVEHHRDPNRGQHPTAMPPRHHTFPPTVRDSNVELSTPPKTMTRDHWSPTRARPEATVITARPRQAKSVEYPKEDYYVRDKEPIFQDPRTHPLEVQYFEALEDEIRGSKFLTESVRLVSSNTFEDLIRETLANKKKPTQKQTKNVPGRVRPDRIRPSAPHNDIQSNEIIRGKIHPQTQAPRLIENEIVMDIQDTDDHHVPPRQNTRHRLAFTSSSEALIDSLYNFRNFETPMVKFSSKEAWRNRDIHKYIPNKYSSQTEHPSQYPTFRPQNLHRLDNPVSRPPSPTSRPPSPTSRPPSPTSRPPSPTSRPPNPTSRPPSPTSSPPRPVSHPPTTVSRPPSPTSRPHSPVSRPLSPTSRPHSLVSHPHSQVSRPDSPTSHHHSPVSHPLSSVLHPHGSVSNPHSRDSHPDSPTSRHHSPVSHTHSSVLHPQSSVSNTHSQVSRPHSSVSHPHNSVSHPLSRVSHPHSPVSRPPSSVSHPPTEPKKTIVTKYYYEKPTEDQSVLRPQNDRSVVEHRTIDHPFTKNYMYNDYELVDHFPPEKENPLYEYERPGTGQVQSFFDEFSENHDDGTRTSGVFDRMFQTHKSRPSPSIEDVYRSKSISRIDPPPGYHPFQGNSPPIPRKPGTPTTYHPKYATTSEVPDRDATARFAADLYSNHRKLDDYSSIFTENMGGFQLSNLNNRRSNYHLDSEPTYGVHPTINIGVGASYKTTQSPSQRPGESMVFTSMPYFEYSSRSGLPNEDITPQPSSIIGKKEETRNNLTEIKQYVREPRMSHDGKGATSFVVPTISQREMIATPSLLAAFFNQKNGKSLYEPWSSVEQKPAIGSNERISELKQGKSLESGDSITANADSTFPEHGYNIDTFFDGFPVFDFFQRQVEV